MNAPATPQAAMREYLAWETDLLPRIERDGSLKFRARFIARPRAESH